MAIGPKYKVNRIILRLRQQKEQVEKAMKRTRSKYMKSAFKGSITSLDHCIAILRSEIR